MIAMDFEELNVWFDTRHDRVDAVIGATFFVAVGEFGLVDVSGSGTSAILRAIPDWPRISRE